MASHNSNDFSSPQEAIEGYLEALLEDVAEYEESDELSNASSPIDPGTASSPIVEEPTEQVATPIVEPPVLEPEVAARTFAPSSEEPFSAQPQTEASPSIHPPPR